ncbi:PCMD domain-containing protein [Saccharicrinis aurantiacus]|uniref:PCMD domain-containing protein n=1 Tax=Saccharicrinis aurantiacus TaxID=1849719 RepID=UPI00095013E8|nr:PCMD domain-containing protein [Saccharicrinis aurantiacus]
MNNIYIKQFTAFVLFLLLSYSCIENDIPYRKVFGGFTSFTVEGQIGESIIDNDIQRIDILVGEEVNLTDVEVLSYSLTENTTVSPDPKEVKNYRDSVLFTVKTYQDYDWTVSISQNIAYDFAVEGQVGSTEINELAKTMKAFVPIGYGLNAITILNLKLGPDGRTDITPSVDGEHNFTSPIAFVSSYDDVTEEWTLSVEERNCEAGKDDAEIESLVFEDMLSATHTVTGFTGTDNNYAYIDVNFPEGTDLSNVIISDFTYSDEAVYSGDWQVGNAIDLSNNHTLNLESPSCLVKNWVIRAHIAEQMPNTNFGDWHENEVFNPWLNQSDNFGYWGTPNVVVLGVKTQTTTPVDGGERGGIYARLETKATGSPLSSFPQIAAGTIFTGQFELAGTSVSTSPNSVNFGERLNNRPIALKVNCGYIPSVINYIDNKVTSEGEIDKAHIWVKLMYLEGDIDYDNGIDHESFQGRKPQALHLPKNAIILGEAEKILEGEISSQEFRLPIEYDIQHVAYTPTHIAIVATASIEGESFTGGVGSILEIDYFELEY